MLRQEDCCQGEVSLDSIANTIWKYQKAPAGEDWFFKGRITRVSDIEASKPRIVNTYILKEQPGLGPSTSPWG